MWRPKIRLENYIVLFLFKIGIVNKWLRKTLIHLRRSFKKANNKGRNI